MRAAVALAALILSMPAVAADYPVVDTGQARCYDDSGPIACPRPGARFFGQDAQVEGTQPRLRDNGDGTVSDLVTGLMWERAFHRDISFAGAPADAARARAGGHADWRVPTIKELYSLIRFDGATGTAGPGRGGAPADARPYLDTGAFAFEYPARGRYIDAQYVTATAYGGRVMDGRAAFFGVNFADGRIKGYPQDGGPGRRGWYARYVRGNPAYARNDFADAGDGTVTDRATGLTWTTADSGGGLDWEGALAWCEGLELAGHADWRLPNAKELHSIVDYSRSPDATGSAAIDPVFAISEIRDDEGRRDWPFFWTSTTHLDGRRPGDFAVYIAFGRALGYMPRGGPRGGGPRMGPPGMGGPESIRDTTGMVLMDVHGAGAQRSSPKAGDQSRLPKGAGPQGDVLRINNHARCVRGG